MTIRQVAEESDTPGGRRFDTAVLVLILVSLVSPFETTRIPVIKIAEESW